MQLDFLFDTGPKKHASGDVLPVADEWLPIRLVRNNRARRYVLRLSHQGEVRVTIPRRGTRREALKLAHDNVSWLERQWQKHRQPIVHARAWTQGTEILFRGEPVSLVIVEKNSVREIQFAGEAIAIDVVDEIKRAVELHLWTLAKGSLPSRVSELAARHAFRYSRISIRNQRSRWGSCSPSGTISLNWRLIQMPPEVCDYIILHELAHTRHLDHSPKFWQEVKRVCPEFRAAEEWIRRHGEKLLPAV